MRDVYSQRRRDAAPRRAERFDEDEVPLAAAVLAAVTDPVPVHTTDGRPVAHLGQLLWRAAGLAVLVGLVYLPVLIKPALTDGEAEAAHRGTTPTLAVADLWRLPASLVHHLPGVPRLLGVLVGAESRLADSALSHHGLGMAIHCSAAGLLWLVLRRTGRPGAWLAAAAFAAWPGSVAAVEWVDLRGRVWGGLFALLGVLLLLRTCGVPAKPGGAAPADEDEDRPFGWQRWVGWVAAPAGYVVALLALLAAALCQPAVAGAGLIAAMLVAWRGRWRRVDWARLLLPAVVLAVAAAVGLARDARGPRETPFGADPVMALSAPSRALWRTGRMLERVAWPTASADLAVPGSHLFITCGVGAAFWAALVAAVLLRRRIGAGPAVACWAFALLLPTATAPGALALSPTDVPPGNPAATYLCVVPVLVVLADGVVVVAARVRADLARRLAEVAAAAAAVVAVAAMTATRSVPFQDSDGVYRAFVDVEGRSWSSRSLLAEHDIRRGQLDAAQGVLNGMTLDRCPDATTAVAYGDLLEADNDVVGALPWYQKADQLDPADVTGVLHEAQADLLLRRPGDAIDCYLKGVDRLPDSADLRNAFGVMLYNQGEPPTAAEQFRQALRIDPDMAEAHLNLATTLFVTGQVDEGVGQLHQALELDPDNYKACHTAGVVLTQMRLYAQAIQWLQAAVTLKSDWPDSRNDLGVALIQAGFYKRAIPEFETALQLRPGYAPAEQNLAVARRKLAEQRRLANVTGK